MPFDIKTRVKELEDELIALRRDFHMHPELGMEEHRTAGIVEDYLKGLGLEVSRMCGTGVIGLLKGGQPGKTLMLRADMDALPIQEATGLEFASKTPGVMHACGHDGHTSMMMIAAKILSENRESLKGDVKFVFQPNEENGCALDMVEAGVMQNPSVDAVMGTHLMTGMRIGTISADDGPVMAEANVFRLTLKGLGGHTAVPEDAVDPILGAAGVIQQLQAIQTRELSPHKAVALVFGSIHAGTAANIIPDKVELQGTLRCLFNSKKEPGEYLLDRFERIVSGICAAHRMEYQLEWTFHDPAVINDAEISAIVRSAATDVIAGTDNKIVPYVTMIGEDFCRFSQEVPGTFYFVGVANPEKKTDFPHHHPSFDIDEDGLAIGVELHVTSALHYLNGQLQNRPAE
ncbi:M20 metallopeptidase family protein [Roseovarius rhodophyticola]|uniref:Amidohydrolase n=1 Tax=Roseovarius rhodophyticola TaxID=3080827 RepID=A0ABZ2TFU4_9RHOB|nr:amidohydrolase [Roseovarius sp. W115]MDV2928775.1 amidohydrolase [Roseovarius sp. W115]